MSTFTTISASGARGRQSLPMSPAAVRSIRTLYAKHDHISMRDLAAYHGVCVMTIYRIIHRLTYRSVK